MKNKEYIDYYYENIKIDKNNAIEVWKKLRKNKINYFSLGLIYSFKYIYLNIKESFRYILHFIKIYIKLFINYLIISIKFNKVKLKKFDIKSDVETIEKIVNEGCSIARFGDGEFKWILGIKQKSFQQDSDELSIRLEEVLKNIDNDLCLIGINDNLNSLKEYNIHAKYYWKDFLVKYHSQLYDLLPDRQYVKSNITRPYMDYKNKNRKVVQDRFDNLRRIWNDKDVIIVEGEFTKLGIGNDLFNNCKSIKRIICPATDAFSKYNEIVSAVRKQNKNKLILMALGPTATVLAYDMSKEGYQCIDIGHIDIEYMWFLSGTKNKDEISGKYVNEACNNISEEYEIDEKYLNEIIFKIL